MAMTQAEILEEFRKLTHDTREPPPDFMDVAQWKETLQVGTVGTYTFLKKANEAGILETDWKMVSTINGKRFKKPVYRLKQTKKRGKK